MERRAFLFAAGAALPLWLLPFSGSILFRPAQREWEEPPLRGLSRCRVCGEWKGTVVEPNGFTKRAYCRCRPSVCRHCGEIDDPRQIGEYYWCEERQALIHMPRFMWWGHIRECPKQETPPFLRLPSERK